MPPRHPLGPRRHVVALPFDAVRPSGLVEAGTEGARALVAKDGHQRELLKILQQMEISEEDEGYLFDICMTIWEKINIRLSLCWRAFNTIVMTAKRHP